MYKIINSNHECICCIESSLRLNSLPDGPNTKDGQPTSTFIISDILSKWIRTHQDIIHLEKYFLQTDKQIFKIEFDHNYNLFKLVK